MTADPHLDPFLVLASFAKALAHRIRTPLTVVTNELSYLATQGHDCGRAIQRSKDIAEILKVACLLGSPTPHDSSIDISESLKKVFPALTATTSAASSMSDLPFIAVSDSVHLEATMRLVARLITDLSGEAEVHQPITYAVDATHAVLTLRCRLHDPISAQGTYKSLTELFTSQLHLDLIEPPLIDAGAFRTGTELAAVLTDGNFELRCTWRNAK